MAQVLLKDDFSELETGMFSADVGPHTEYHFLPEAAPKGNWSVAAFGSGDAGRAWHVQKVDDSHQMLMAVQNTRITTHPILTAGDPFWHNYTIRTTLTPGHGPGQCGVMVRYQNSRCYYFFGFDVQGIVLKMVQHAQSFEQPYEVILARQDCDWERLQRYTLNVSVEGDYIEGEISGLIRLSATDSTYADGKIGLLADMPTAFHEVLVEATEDAVHRLNLMRGQAERTLDEMRAANPQPVVWKKIDVRGFGAGRNLRFGDLNNDGQMDILIGQIHHHGPADAYSELSCLTALTFDGEMLWQIGQSDPEKYRLTNDTGFQIHDFDGDGRNEVIYTMNQEIFIIDAATGQIKHRAPTPQSKPPANQFPRILGDSIFFCDLRGTGAKRDMIIKDRYWHFWALNDQLEVMWEGSCKTGHYPYAADIDGDGCDELAIGFSMYDHDGTLLWSLDNQIQDHADGVAIVNFDPESGQSPIVFYTASDSGVLLVDLEGKIIRQHFIGHAQNPAIGKFRTDLPGLQAVTVNFWGNQGILHFFDAKGNIYHSAEPNNFGSMCLPINWTGKPAEYFVHSANIRLGGMFDGWARPVVMFPNDGHPDMCNAVLDIMGDCRDEVVVWDQNEIWVYTQDDNPLTGRLYQPVRNALHNYSNYQASVSTPGWYVR